MKPSHHHAGPTISASTEAQDRFERTLRERADMEDRLCNLPASMLFGRTPTRLAAERLRSFADTFRGIMSGAELGYLERAGEHEMRLIAETIAQSEAP